MNIFLVDTRSHKIIPKIFQKKNIQIKKYIPNIFSCFHLLQQWSFFGWSCKVWTFPKSCSRKTGIKYFDGIQNKSWTNFSQRPVLFGQNLVVPEPNFVVYQRKCVDSIEKRLAFRMAYREKYLIINKTFQFTVSIGHSKNSLI